MSRTYLTAPRHNESTNELRHAAPDGRRVSLTRCGGSFLSMSASWLVSLYSDTDRSLDVRSSYPWTAAGERAARKEYARLVATLAPAAEVSL